MGAHESNVRLDGRAGLYREGAYVALSRARYEAWLYATSVQAPGLKAANRETSARLRCVTTPIEGWHSLTSYVIDRSGELDDEPD